MSGQASYQVEIDREAGVFNILVDYFIPAYVDPETGEYFGDTSWSASYMPEGGSGGGFSGVGGESGYAVMELGFVSGDELRRYALDFVATNTFSAEQVALSWTVIQAGYATEALVGVGTDAVDIIVTGAGADLIDGAAGDDVIDAGAGDDVVQGGAGGDRLNGGGGDDELIGGSGNDTYTVDSALDRVVEASGGGQDAVFALVDYTVGVEIERLILLGVAVEGRAGAGDQQMYGNALANKLFGGDGDDHLSGEDGDDQLFGGLGADRLIGGAGADRLAGGLGDDRYTVADGNDQVIEVRGGGFDTVESVNGDRHLLAANVENLERYARGDFTGVGNGLDNRMIGGLDRDTFLGGLGNDTLEGRDGDDRLIGGEGRDVLIGGEGQDTAEYAGSSTAVRVNLETGRGRGGAAHHDTLIGVENLLGSAYDDRLTGAGGGNRLIGGFGDDRIAGGGGDDIVVGGAGADRLDGGEGRDTLSYVGSTRGGVTVDLARGTASGGDAAGDRISGFENLRGGAGNDTLTGDGGDNVIAGGRGADRLTGGAGRDTLNYTSSVEAVTVDLAAQTASGGEAQGDVVAGFENAWGGGGDDVLSGGAGANRLTGGNGDDRLDGRGGDDVITGGVGADAMIGGLGRDTLSYLGTERGLIVDLELQLVSAAGAMGDTISGFENARGGEGSDGLYGDDRANQLWGGGGFDVIDGRGGNDRLTGEGGPDRFVFGGGYGHDVVVDFEDGDQLQFVFGSGSASYESVIGSARAVGPNGEHTLFQFESGTSLLLLNVAKDTLTADDIFVPEDFVV